MSIRAFSTAATGMHARELQIDAISHNIANISTTGYKRQRPEFVDLLYQDLTRAGVNTSDTGTIAPVGTQVGLGVKSSGIHRISTQGDLKQTEAPLDLAIRGIGLFRVTLPSGEFAYTRAGSFQLSNQREIVTDEGYQLSPGIIIPEDATGITVNSLGEVYANVPGNIDPQLLGQFDIVTFANVDGLEAIGGNLLMETAASGTPVVGVAGTNQMGTILQGWLENSNVNPVTELTDLISAQRAYETCSKIIQAGDQMLRTINETKA